MNKVIINVASYFSYNSVIILSYFLICLCALLINFICKGRFNNYFSLKKGSFLNPMTYIRLVTTGICHNDWSHFRNNFVMILLIGPMLEEKYGSITLLKMLLLTTIFSSVIHLLFYKSSAIGASDNVYMLVVLCSIVNISNGKIPITLVLILLFYVADEIIKWLFKKDNVAHDSHVIGAICGLIFGFLRLV